MSAQATAARPAIALRPARNDDRGFLLRVYGSTRELELSMLPWSHEQKQAFVRQQFEAQDRHYRANYAGAEFLVIQVGGADAGRLYVRRTEREIHVLDIALLSEHRGRGIGAEILGGLMAEGERTRRLVSLHVERFNPAARLYERLGFKAVEEPGLHVLLEWRPDVTGKGEALAAAS